MSLCATIVTWKFGTTNRTPCWLSASWRLLNGFRALVLGPVCRAELDESVEAVAETAGRPADCRAEILTGSGGWRYSGHVEAG